MKTRASIVKDLCVAGHEDLAVELFAIAMDDASDFLRDVKKELTDLGFVDVLRRMEDAAIQIKKQRRDSMKEAIPSNEYA